MAKERMIEWNGKKQNARTWAKELGISNGTLSYRLAKGWPLQKALKCKQYLVKGGLIGKRFGRLVVKEPTTKRSWRYIIYKCRCDCGNYVEVASRHLTSSKSKSCGCYHLDRVSKHGHTKSHTSTRSYESWGSMKQRCLNPNAQNYYLYGGRGISICDEWLDKDHGFENFLADMGERPDGTSIDRINPDGNYEPSNCRWATPKQQQNNRRCSKRAA